MLLSREHYDSSLKECIKGLPCKIDIGLNTYFEPQWIPHSCVVCLKLEVVVSPETCFWTQFHYIHITLKLIAVASLVTYFEMKMNVLKY